MSKQDQIDFLTTFGREFSFEFPTDLPFEAVPHDAYEVWKQVFKAEPTSEALTSLGEQDIGKLRQGFARQFDCDVMTTEQIKNAVTHILFHQSTK
jgi:hypothetical protein